MNGLTPKSYFPGRFILKNADFFAMYIKIVFLQVCMSMTKDCSEEKLHTAMKKWLLSCFMYMQINLT